MEIFQTWFDLSDKYTYNRDHVLSFLERLPGKIGTFVREDNSNFFYILKIVESPITPALFLTELEYAANRLYQNLSRLRERFESVEFRNAFDQVLADIGFAQNSLLMKATHLNFLWTRVLRGVGNASDAIIDFANDKLVKLLRRFFEYLNSILGSLKELIPGAEAIKELKEIIESFLGIADED
jgi:hypothetical protein